MKAYVFPGQGSQYRGMGEGVFDYYRELTEQADDILGYSVKKLCLEDPQRQLSQTQYTQPALYVVCCLSYLQTIEQSGKPDFLAGHSLGEYTALFAANSFDFGSGLKLVKRRGELMSQATGGTMAAVMGCDQETVENILAQNDLNNIDIANYNTPTQLVLSGPKDAIDNAQKYFDALQIEDLIYYPLNVSAPFHSRYMSAIAEEFAADLSATDVKAPTIPVISNVTARPYEGDDICKNLLWQMKSSVKWTDSVRYLSRAGVTEYKEIGPLDVLTKLIAKIND